MNYIENINYRHELLQKESFGKKLTSEEKEWCKSNPIFNERYEEPCYQRDILHLPSNCLCNITTTLIHRTKGVSIIPIIGVVLGKGSIYAKSTDLSSGEIKEICTKKLGVLISEERPISSISFLTKNGYMSVEYECKYFDSRMNMYKREPSILNFAYGMKKEEVSDNKIIYRCKHPLSDKNNFSDYVFSLEWEICL